MLWSIPLRVISPEHGMLTAFLLHVPGYGRKQGNVILMWPYWLSRFRLVYPRRTCDENLAFAWSHFWFTCCSWQMVESERIPGWLLPVCLFRVVYDVRLCCTSLLNCIWFCWCSVQYSDVMLPKLGAAIAAKDISVWKWEKTDNVSVLHYVACLLLLN